MLDERVTFTVLNDEGEKVECELLYSFENAETGKNYIVYTDNTLDAEGNTKVFASTYDPKVDDFALGPIETEREWQLIEAILDRIMEEANGQGS